MDGRTDGWDPKNQAASRGVGGRPELVLQVTDEYSTYCMVLVVVFTQQMSNMTRPPQTRRQDGRWRWHISNTVDGMAGWMDGKPYTMDGTRCTGTGSVNQPTGLDWNGRTIESTGWWFVWFVWFVCMNVL